MTDRPLIAITLGDPSGVGPEVVAKALANPALHEAARLFVIGALEPMQAAVAQTGTGAQVRAITAPADAASTASTIDVLEVADAPTSGFPTGELSTTSERGGWPLRQPSRCPGCLLRRSNPASRGAARALHVSRRTPPHPLTRTPRPRRAPCACR